MPSKPEPMYELPLEPDTLLPSQYLALRDGQLLRPEKRLLLAVLEDAVECFQTHVFSNVGRGKRMHNNARDWIWSPERRWVFSFLNICDVLSLDPNYLRRGLAGYKQRMLREDEERRAASATPLPVVMTAK